MEDHQIFLLFLLLTPVNFVQNYALGQLLRNWQPGNRQVTNPEWRCHFTHSAAPNQAQVELKKDIRSEL